MKGIKFIGDGTFSRDEQSNLRTGPTESKKVAPKKSLGLTT